MGAWNLLYWLAWGKNRLIDSGDALVVLTRKQETTINWEEISAIHWHSGDYFPFLTNPASLTPPRVDIELRIRPEVVSSGGFLLWFPRRRRGQAHSRSRLQPTRGRVRRKRAILSRAAPSLLQQVHAVDGPLLYVFQFLGSAFSTSRSRPSGGARSTSASLITRAVPGRLGQRAPTPAS